MSDSGFMRFAMLLTLVTGLVACGSPDRSSARPEVQRVSADEGPQQTEPGIARATIAVAGITVIELGSYQKAGRTWRNLVIPRNLDRQTLVAIARELHEHDPISAFRFFDDTSKYGQFELWDQHGADPRYPSPEAWVRRHYIAMLNKMLANGGPRWKLEAMEGGIHLLPDETSMTIAVID